jgi:hypothetical protein
MTVPVLNWTLLLLCGSGSLEIVTRIGEEENVA